MPEPEIEEALSSGISDDPTKSERVDDGIAWRSVSQLKEYNECQYRYYLHREEKVWQRPAAWLPQGLGVHEGGEFYELSDRKASLEEVQAVYTESYDKHTNRLLAETQRTKDWFRSGPYDGATDIERRYKLGLEHVERYIAYYDKHPDEKPMTFDDGSKAVEWAFNVYFGETPVRGIIDFVDEPGKPRDTKSGNRPGDVLQLGVYAGAIEKELGIKPTTGDFLMTKSGKTTYPLDLRDYTEQYLADIFGEMDAGVKAEKFDPDPSEDKCRFCPVSRACEFSASYY